MTRNASSSNSGAGSSTRPTAASSNGLDEALTRFQNEIDAVAVGVSVGDGSLSKNISRSGSASRLLAEVWQHGAAGLMTQARASAGAIGTNKLRGVADGPVCGKLIATALRDSSGAMTGLVVALRAVEQDKFTQRESQKILELAAEVATLLARKAPEPPAGLMSWSVFDERATAQERTSKTSGCVLYGNVDQLHVLNKLAGFAAGDRAIEAVGEVLQSEKHLPSGAGACHLSGDRFTVYLPATDLPLGRKIAEALGRAVSDRCARLDGLRTKLSISFGVASIPESESGVTQALAAAESACRAAKERGRGRVEVYQDTDHSMVRRNDEVAIAGRLRKALETETFAIVAQPLHRLQDDGEPDCYELLVRFVDETGVLLAAGGFMSAAKRYQLLVELDRAVITKVFESLKGARMLRESHGVRYSLNLSGPTINDASFLEWLLSNIGPHGVPGEWLQFELTESAAVANVAQTQNLISRLRARGVEFALDDFGTGASSFSYLKMFDVSTLKLDGSFTRELLTEPRSESLVRGIAQLGRGMNIQTAAECVETREVRDRLKDLGIDRAQGFFFGQPVPFEQVLAERAAASASILSPAAAEKILAASEVVRAEKIVAPSVEAVATPSAPVETPVVVNAASPSASVESLVVASAVSPSASVESLVIASAVSPSVPADTPAAANAASPSATDEAPAAEKANSTSAPIAPTEATSSASDAAVETSNVAPIVASGANNASHASDQSHAGDARDVSHANDVRGVSNPSGASDAPNASAANNAGDSSGANDARDARDARASVNASNPGTASAAQPVALASDSRAQPVPTASVPNHPTRYASTSALPQETSPVSDSASELEQLVRSAEELHIQSQRLTLTANEVAALSQQLARSQDAAAGINNDPTIEQPAAGLGEYGEPTLEQPVLSTAQVETTVEQPRPPIVANG